MDDNFKWIMGILIPVVVAIVIFVGNRIVKRNDERKRERNQRLKTHFDDINKSVVDTLKKMSVKLQIGNNRLEFATGAPVTEQYPFEEDDNYISFGIHFPEIAKEWEQLKAKALSLDNVYQELQTKSGDEYETERKAADEKRVSLEKKFQDFYKGCPKKLECKENTKLALVFILRKIALSVRR